MFKECLGKEFDEVVEIVKAVAEEKEGCFEYTKDEEEIQYSELVYSVSPYGFCADTYDFEFDEKGVCVEIEFEEFDEDEDYFL